MNREPTFDRPAGPSRGFCAWADASVQFPPASREQEQLRDGIRERARLMRGGPDQLLHAVYAGPKHPMADIENVLLYNIDSGGGSFRPAARAGLRFEWSPGAVPSYRRSTWGCWFGYRLAEPTDGFLHWKPGRMLAEWEDLAVGSLDGERKLERVWLGLRRAAPTVSWPARSHDQEFTIHLRLTVPPDCEPLAGGLVKGLFDGVVCALQGHAGDHVDSLAQRLAAVVPAAGEELSRLLTGGEQAVLGSRSALLHARGRSVQWAPDDHLLVAGELSFEHDADAPWCLSGRVFEATQADWAQEYYMESG